MRSTIRGVACVAACGAMMWACGGSRSAGVAGQADLLAEDDVVEVAAEAGGLPKSPGAPKPAAAVTSAELTETRCLGFLPTGGAFVGLEERMPGEKGPVRVVRTVVSGAADGHGLPEMELGRMGPDDASDDEMFGDALEISIGEHLEAVNGAITGKAMLGCQSGVDLEMGAGGFRRKVREVVAFPNGAPFKVSLREGALFAGPATGAARQYAEAPAEEGAQYKLTDVWFTTTTPGIVAVISDASSEQARRVVVHVPTE